LLRDMVQTQQPSSPVKAKQVKKAKKTMAKAARPKIQKEFETQNEQYGQQLVVLTSGHSYETQYRQLLVEYDTVGNHSEDATPTHHCGEYEQLTVEGVNAGVWPSDDSSVSTLSYSVEDLMGFDENWLEVEDDFLGIFRAEFCIVGVPSTLSNAAHCYY
jgi:hypothetical protein